MRERTFAARREDGWERLDALVARAERSGLRSLAPAELGELALRYRSATTDLAAAQSRAYSPDLTGYLNRLTARAYAFVHGSSARGGWSNVATFFTSTFPREVRRSGRIILATAALFVAAWIVSYWLVEVRPSNAYALMPAELIPNVSKRLHDSNFAFDPLTGPAEASEIITNNIRVAMSMVAGGMTLGVLTLYEIVFNGLMVGTFGALFSEKGFGSDYWATIAPHGVIELTSLQLAGAAGLLLAQAIVAPGRLRRIDALKANGRRAGVLMAGVAGMLVIAGTIEGFVTPQRSSELFRLGVGAVTAACLVAYFGLAGRSPAGLGLAGRATARRVP
jgi:uncharacterized membrane protein SpoIIM required for sporulation